MWSNEAQTYTREQRGEGVWDCKQTHYRLFSSSLLSKVSALHPCEEKSDITECFHAAELHLLFVRLTQAESIKGGIDRFLMGNPGVWIIVKEILVL